MPGMPMLLMRPVHAIPVLQVPFPPVPQQGWPAPPQAPHWLPAVATMQLSSPVHAGVAVPASAPPPPPPPPPVGQHGCPAPPHVAHMPGTPVALMRPVHASPVVHVPFPPEPQQACPAAPQVPHWFPVAETMQLNAD